MFDYRVSSSSAHPCGVTGWPCGEKPPQRELWLQWRIQGLKNYITKAWQHNIIWQCWIHHISQKLINFCCSVYYRSFRSAQPSTLWMPALLLTTNQGIAMPTYNAVSQSTWELIYKTISFVLITCFRWPQPCQTDIHWRIWTWLYQWKFHWCELDYRCPNPYPCSLVSGYKCTNTVDDPIPNVFSICGLTLYPVQAYS